MLKNYFIIVFRNIKKYKAYSFINVLGLALGVAIFFISVQFTTYQLSWDKFQSKSNDIYRIHQKFNDGGITVRVSYPVKEALLTDYPEIEQATSFAYGERNKIYIDVKPMIGEDIFFIEPEFFDIFDVTFIKGSKSLVQDEMKKNHNIAILTDEYATVLFGDQDPINKTFSFGEGEHTKLFTVFAIVDEYPETSHFKFNILLPIAGEPFFKSVEGNWNNPVVYTYVYIPDEDKAKIFTKQETLDKFIERHFPPKFGGPEAHLPVIAMTDIHLKSSEYYELGGNSSIIIVYIVGSIGLLILALASINFMNLTTAKSTRRAKEVGMRKSLGATRFNLIKQFIGEAIIFSAISVILGMLLAEFFLPIFNENLNQELKIEYFNNWFTIPVMVLIALALGLISGAYPAFVLSSFKPINALKDVNKSARNMGGFMVRKGLVIVQFVVVALLLVTIITLQSQLSYIAGKDLGYDNHNNIFVRSSELMMMNPDKYKSFLNEVRDNDAIKSIAGFANWDYQTVQYEGMDPNDRKGSNVMSTSADFAKTMGVRILAGRLPSREIASDREGIIFNQTSVKQFGWTPQEAVGKQVKLYEGDSTYTVLGVFQDYHVRDLISEIEPQALIVNLSEYYWTSMISYKEGRKEEAIAVVKNAWSRYDDGWPFEVFHSQDEVQKSYAFIVDLQQIMSYLTFLGIFIACMGLYGLTAFSTERRTKEIGIRKVLGASLPEVYKLIISEFTIIVVIATLIGLAGGYAAGEYILQNFAYRISVGPFILISAAVISIAIAIFTVSYQAIKAGMINPVNTLKIE